MIAGFHTAAFHEHDWATARAVLTRIGYAAIGVRLSRARLNPLADACRRDRQIAMLGSAASEGAASEGAASQGAGWIVDADGHYLLDPWSPEVGDLMAEGRDRERRIECLRGAIRIAAQIGCRLVTFATGPLPTGMDAQRGLDRLAEAVARITPAAEQAGVTLAIRPRHEHFVDSIGRFERLAEWLGETADLQLAADVGTMVGGGEMPIVDSLVRTPRLACVYLSEVRWVVGAKAKADALIGGSHVAADRVAAGLAEHGFPGPLLVEPAHAEVVDPSIAAAFYERIFGHTAGRPPGLDPLL